MKRYAAFLIFIGFLTGFSFSSRDRVVPDGHPLHHFARIDKEKDDLRYRLREARAEVQRPPLEDQDGVVRPNQSAVPGLLQELKNKTNEQIQALRSFRRDRLTGDEAFGSRLLPQFNGALSPYKPADKWASVETLKLTEIESLRTPRLFATSMLSPGYVLKLENRLPLEIWESRFSVFDERRNQGVEAYLQVQMECSHPVTVRQSFDLFGPKRGRSVRFDLYNKMNNGQKTKITFSSLDSHCVMKFKFPWESGYAYALELVDESRLYPNLNDLRATPELCLTGARSHQSPADVFFSGDYPTLGCVHPASEAKILADPYDSFRERLRILTGSDIPRKAFETQDFDFPMDFSQAPKLDLILVSTLQLKSDFSGYTLARALKFHAQRGTMVRIMSTGILLRGKDKVMLEKLIASGGGHIKYKEFWYDQSGPASGSLIDNLHRVNHIKLLVTWSASSPEHSAVITGGRNVRDSYYFRKAPNYSHRPEMIQYHKKEEPFIHYVDSEILVRSPELARQTAAQTLAFFNHDESSMRFERSSYQVPVLDASLVAQAWSKIDSKQVYARHFISLPYVDGREMEDVFLAMIESARKRIRIISPYFHPQPAILEALKRAADRGVRIQVITRIDLAGDDIPKITEDVNKKAINDTYRRMEIFEWIEEDSILHSKALAIDDQIIYLGGTNLNRRSFTHDTENGFIFAGGTVLRDFNNLYDRHYLKLSSRVTEAKYVSFINRLLISIGGGFF